MDRPRAFVHYSRRFENTTTSQVIVQPTTDSGTETSISEQPGSPAPVSPHISSSAVVGQLAQAATPSSPVANPILSIPTSTYTGQALISGACALPQYTALPLSDGDYLAVPVVGCGKQNPQCCPPVPKESNTLGGPPASTIPLSQANSALVSYLSAHALTVCPADYTSTARNCCPV